MSCFMSLNNSTLVLEVKKVRESDILYRQSEIGNEKSDLFGMFVEMEYIYFISSAEIFAKYILLFIFKSNLIKRKCF